ncbi:hypothetical protein Q5P01_001139 [Channa striata]|uniref:Uncharacterized protein n=1 Tax=Channa striata TaxID=64152 RepID=A0AA88NK51_CHASR|nr:hypothetical protein Q5P01_001139 [Channa striata]
MPLTSGEHSEVFAERHLALDEDQIRDDNVVDFEHYYSEIKRKLICPKKNRSCDELEIQLPLSETLSRSTGVQFESPRSSRHSSDKQSKSTARCMPVYSPRFFPEIFATDSFCSVDEAFLLPAEMQLCYGLLHSALHSNWLETMTSRLSLHPLCRPSTKKRYHSDADCFRVVVGERRSQPSVSEASIFDTVT